MQTIDVNNREEVAKLLAAAGRGNFQFDGRRVERRTMYIRKSLVSITGRFRMIEEGTDKSVGTTNFPKGNQLPANIDIIVLGVKAKCDTTTAALTAALYRSLPAAALQNGELHISQDGALLDTPLSVLFNPGTATNAADDFFPITPTFISQQKAFEIEVETMAGVSTSATTCLAIELDCLVLVK